MKFTAGEKATFCAILLIFVVLVACRTASRGYVEHVASIEREEMSQINRTCEMNEWVDLDSRQDLVTLSTGKLYSSDFPWEGKIRVSVRDARLFEDFNAVHSYIGDDRGFLLSDEYVDSLAGALIVTIDVNNIDATSTSTQLADPYCFTASVFNVIPFDEIIGFDSPPDDLADQNEYARRCFRLNPGETKTVRIAYGVSKQSEFERGEFSIWAGYCNQKKYRFKLNVVNGDER